MLEIKYVFAHGDARAADARAAAVRVTTAWDSQTQFHFPNSGEEEVLGYSGRLYESATSTLE